LSDGLDDGGVLGPLDRGHGNCLQIVPYYTTAAIPARARLELLLETCNPAWSPGQGFEMMIGLNLSRMAEAVLVGHGRC